MTLPRMSNWFRRRRKWFSYQLGYEQGFQDGMNYALRALDLRRLR